MYSQLQRVVLQEMIDNLIKFLKKSFIINQERELWWRTKWQTFWCLNGSVA